MADWFINLILKRIANLVNDEQSVENETSRYEHLLKAPTHGFPVVKGYMFLRMRCTRCNFPAVLFVGKHNIILNLKFSIYLFPCHKRMESHKNRQPKDTYKKGIIAFDRLFTHVLM